ncbi:MAG: putative maltokinase, partial [Gemmataceae bacterium]|nr:putative maltokinase [Gemmataceae bacterium]
DHLARAYYWHRFYGHQPDLNFDNPAVWEALFPVLDFWMGLGVDGMRLDAIPYLYEREGTNCENLPETHDFLRALRRHVDSRFANRMLLAEANQWPEEAVAYFGSGDECQMAFHFPVMPRMFMAIHMEDRFPIVEIMGQTPPIPDNCQWGLFLRNHDELTLEMVTDEERDYMYRAYANDPRARINLGIRRRLAPLLGNSRRRIELMNGLLFSMPGTPVLYYGDEIGMGDNVYLGDRNGVRTPMQWSADRNAGFSRANPQKLYLPVIIDPEYHYEAINVEALQNNPNSLLWWMKRLITLRKRHKAFGRGTLEFLHPANRKILAFLRRHEGETILVVANLARFVEYVELDLSAFQGLTPVELFSRNLFPPIGRLPYLLTLGPHSFYWFTLESSRRPDRLTLTGSPEELPELTVKGTWEELFRSPGRGRLEEVLPGYLRRQPWVINGGKVKSATVQEVFRLRYLRDSQPGREGLTFIAMVGTEFTEGEPRTYVLPLTVVSGDTAALLLESASAMALAFVRGEGGGVLFDALADPAFCAALLDGMAAGKNYRVGTGELVALTFPGFAEAKGESAEPGALAPALNRTPQTNTSVLYGDRLILKVFRRAEEGVNPDLEVVRFLNGKGEPHVPLAVGAIEYRQRRNALITLGVLQRYVPNEGHAWQFTLDELSRYFERVAALPATAPMARSVPAVAGSVLDLAGEEVPGPVRELIDNYLESAALLGRRTAEMHVALASETEDVSFVPEPFGTLYQRSLYQSMRNLKRRTFDLLRERLATLPEEAQPDGRRLLDVQETVLQRFRAVMGRKLNAMRTRFHGDYHLGHVLYTGRDFVIIDFEGETERSLTERQLKRSPLRDVVSMVRSFHYAVYGTLFGRATGRGRSPGLIRPEDVAALEPWARAWHVWVSAAFLRTYLEVAAGSPAVPGDRADLKLLFDTFLLERAVQELHSELTHRPEMARIPLLGVLQALEGGG